LSSPGFFAVTAPKAGQTRVTVTFSAAAAAGAGSSTGFSKGQTATFTLDQWGVLQIRSHVPTNCTPVKSDSAGQYCDLSATTDLTGTIIKADQEVAVFGGHNCTFVPFDKWACDHLEEQLIPVHAMGKKYVAAHTASSGKDPNTYRVVSAVGENVVSFDPPVHAPVNLARGQWVEFTTDKNFKATGSGRFALVQFIVGQNYSDPVPNPGTEGAGDPAMGLSVPIEQYRSSYRFLAPRSYAQNYVNIMARQAATVTLDGTAVPSDRFSSIGQTGYKVAKIQIPGGPHLITSPSPFGINVYGVGSFTSYMYPGGLNLKVLK
jgi:hypothetical protein